MINYIKSKKEREPMAKDANTGEPKKISTAKELMKMDQMELAVYDLINNLPDSLEENEQLCAASLKLNEATTLSGALALWNIGEKGLFREAGFNSLSAYVRERGDKIGISAARSTVSEYLNIAEVFIMHKDALYKAGFRETKDASKLKYLGVAIETHSKKEAIQNLSKMSVRQFSSWARGTDETMRLVEDTNSDELNVTQRGFVKAGKVVISRKKVEEIYEAGETPFVIGIKSPGEARMLGRYLSNRRKKKEEWEEEE